MRHFSKLIFTAFCIGCLLLQSSAEAAPVKGKRGVNSRMRKRVVAAPHAVSFSADFLREASSVYEELGLETYGLGKKAFEYAYKGYDNLVDRGLIKNHILAICDFSQSSRQRRMYIIDMDERRVLINTYVAHGRKSGAEFATSFSNSMSSHKSSLGFYITGETYFGDHGLSLRIRGLEKGFNDKAEKRAVVVHGSQYVGPDFLTDNPFTGRSYGCPAVPACDSDEVIQTIKDGACLFIYHPTKKYLARSKILNS